MDGNLRFSVGVMASAASFVLYAAPILTFERIVRKRSTEGFSYVPYVLALFNTLLYTWYGLPIVSFGWENIPLFAINALGIFLEITFVGIYASFASPKQRRFVCVALIAVLVLFSATVSASLLVLHNRQHRKMAVGMVGVLSSICLYASPLAALKQVVRTKDSEFMPFPLSLATFLASSLWMIYGLSGNDLFVASPNLLGCPLGFVQIVLYFVYKKPKTASLYQAEEPLLLA